MKLWKAIAGLAVISIVFGFLLEVSPPQQRQMLMCAITPNCVYVMGVQQK